MLTPPTLFYLFPILIKPFLQFSFLSSCLFIFVLWPTEFYEGHLNDHRNGTIQWILVGSLVGTYLKIMTTSSPESIRVSSFLEGRGMSNHSCYELMIGMSVSWPEDNILHPFSLSSGSCITFTSSMIFPEPKVGGINFPFGLEHSAFPYSQYLQQARVSAFAIVRCKMKLL